MVSSEKGVSPSLFASPKASLNKTLFSAATNTTPEKFDLITVFRQSLNDNLSLADAV
jgi:hypothetical protein